MRDVTSGKIDTTIRHDLEVVEQVALLQAQDIDGYTVTVRGAHADSLSISVDIELGTTGYTALSALVYDQFIAMDDAARLELYGLGMTDAIADRGYASRYNNANTFYSPKVTATKNLTPARVANTSTIYPGSAAKGLLSPNVHRDPNVIYTPTIAQS